MTPRHIFIGDIHGCYAEVVALLGKLNVTADDVVVALGDMVRKGPDAARVLALWREHDYLAVMGNNDAKLVARSRSMLRRLFAPRTDREVMRDRASTEWLAARPLFIDFEEIGVVAVHGGVLPNSDRFDASLVPREAALELRYIRRDATGQWTAIPKGEQRRGDPFWSEIWNGDRMIVYGHTPRREPRIDPHAIGLDTGCAYGGSLSAAVFDGREWTIEQVRARDVKNL